MDLVNLIWVIDATGRLAPTSCFGPNTTTPLPDTGTFRTLFGQPPHSVGFASCLVVSSFNHLFHWTSAMTSCLYVYVYMSKCLVVDLSYMMKKNSRNQLNCPETLFLHELIDLEGNSYRCDWPQSLQSTVWTLLEITQILQVWMLQVVPPQVQFCQVGGVGLQSWAQRRTADLWQTASDQSE